MEFKEILKEIKLLPEDNPKAVEGQIRQIDERINALDDGKNKTKLLVQLKRAAADLGLSKELKELINENGLSDEALVLVLKHLTDIPNLAKYLYENSKDKLSEEGLEMISRKLGPKLEKMENDEDKVDVDKIMKKIEALKEDDFKTAEGKIRQIYKNIKALTNEKQKQQLVVNLQGAADLGLSMELKELMMKNGLFDEVLVLVLKHLTDIPDLAKYLYENSKDKLSEEGLEIISRKLGPKLEVLGGLMSKQIDISKECVKQLTEKAPSFCQLSRLPSKEVDDFCKDFSEEERHVIDELIEIAKSQAERDSAFPPDERLAQQNAEKKHKQTEKLEQSKALMKEAQTLASGAFLQNKTELNQKMSELCQKLELPPDWYKQDKVSANDLLTQLNQEISQFEEFIETRPSYDSLEEVAAKASGGLALTGVYYSEYEPPVIAGLPILLPPSKVESKNAKTPFESRYMKFNQESAAASFVKDVESSGFNVAVSMAGHNGLFTAETETAYGSETSKMSSHRTSTTTTSVAVTHHIRIGMKAFQIGRSEMKLRMEARKKALSIDTNDAARQFFKRYGSHVPCGTHNLGGIFFSIANANSNKETEVSTLAHAATQHLHSKVSFGFSGGVFGVGVSSEFGSHSEQGQSEGKQEENNEESYTYSTKSIGPNAENQATFKKHLSNNNSTWAILDRGETTAYVPVWELLQELGDRFKDSANVMRQTWDEDEKQKLKKNCKRELKGEYMRWGAVPLMCRRYLSTGGKLISQEDLTRKEATYYKAIDFVSDDPMYNICEITQDFKCALGMGYTLKCWKASHDERMTFEMGDNSNVMFFSEKYYIWKSEVAGRE